MSDRISRWHCLTILAIVNLVFWVAVAVVVGLAATDMVNLGIETFVREHQATVVTLWKQASPKASGPATRPALPTVAMEKASETPAQPPAAITTPSPQRQATSVVRAGATPQPQPAGSTTRPSTPAGNTAPPPPQPTAALSSSPLLLAEPAFDSLMHLNAEMNRSAVGRAVQIRYGEAMLNQELTSLLASYPDLPYHDLHVQLNRDQVVIQGKITVMGFDVSAQVSGIVVARDCLPQAQVQAVSIVGVSTPGLVKQEVEKIILELLNWYPADYPLCLEQIVVEEGRVTIYGFRR